MGLRRWPRSPKTLRRRLGLDRNPLRRRRQDRLERRTRLVAALAVLLVLPLAAWLGGRSYVQGLRTMRVEWVTRTPVIATLTADTAAAALLAPGGASASGGLTAARWSAKDGTPRAGYLRVGPGTPTGTTVPIWIDQSGNVVGAPLDHVAVVRQAIGDGLSVVVAATLLLLLGLGLLHWRLDRARMRSWAAEWAIVEPQWTADCP